MTAPLHWAVIAVLASGHGIGNCGHEHQEKEQAHACPWTPEPWPEVCDLMVRQMRTNDGRGKARGSRVMRARQLVLW